MKHTPEITQGVEAVLNYLAGELPELMLSGENWQVILHGGRSGDVIVEQMRKATVVHRGAKPPPKNTATFSHD